MPQGELTTIPASHPALPAWPPAATITVGFNAGDSVQAAAAALDCLATKQQADAHAGHGHCEYQDTQQQLIHRLPPDPAGVV